MKLSGCAATAKLRDDGSVFLEPELLTEDKNQSVELPQINYTFNGKKYK